MNDDTLEIFHKFVSQLIEHCHSHLPGIHLTEVKEIVSKVTFNYNVTLLQGVWFK